MTEYLLYLEFSISFEVTATGEVTASKIIIILWSLISEIVEIANCQSIRHFPILT